MNYKLAPADIDRLVQFRNEGSSLPEISRALGVSRETVKRWLRIIASQGEDKARELPNPTCPVRPTGTAPTGVPRRLVTPQVLALMVRLHHEGKSAEMIARITRFAACIIRARLREQGIEPHCPPKSNQPQKHREEMDRAWCLAAGAESLLRRSPDVGVRSSMGD